MRDQIVVLGAQSQTGRIAAQQLRSAHFYCRLLPDGLGAAAIAELDAAGILLTAPLSEPECYEALFSLRVPVLALGKGAESLLARYEAGEDEVPRRSSVEMVRWRECVLFAGIPDGERRVCGAHAYDVPDGFSVIADAESGPAAFVEEDRQVYQLLMRVERNDPDGSRILLNFAEKICGCTPWWTVEGFIEDAISKIREFTGEGSVVCAMSGGLDSTVAGLLARRALGERAHCVFIDTGLMRKGEAEATEHFFREELHFSVMCADISDGLLYTMRGLETQDAKWQIASREIENAIQQAAASVEDVRAVVHGTDAADVLESGEIGAQRPEKALPVLEPLRELFKDEVRRVGEVLGLPQEMLNRQSFPSIGLAARMSGEVTPAKLKMLRAADEAFLDELTVSGHNKRLSSAYAMLDTVGGKHAVILRAVQGQGVNAMAARLPSDLIERTVARIQEEMPQVQRVLYDFTPGIDG